MDVIDSRDIIERIEELEEERLILEEEIMAAEPTDIDEAKDALSDWVSEFESELNALKELYGECDGYVEDLEHGAILIHDDYFAEYAEELCKDYGYIPSDSPFFISNNIDWEGVAEEIKIDYTNVTFDGVDYWVK